jgi:hypothetical protein
MPILDSGNRREFSTGAVRDIAEGKGRCDLLPLDVVGELIGDEILKQISDYVRYGDTRCLMQALDYFSNDRYSGSYETMILAVSQHYEEGCKKYGERNWENGIPLHCYIDSAVRHYLKCLRGDPDEPHDRAFVWNILCAIWTHENKPELVDLPFFVQHLKEKG